MAGGRDVETVLPIIGCNFVVSDGINVLNLHITIEWQWQQWWHQHHCCCRHCLCCCHCLCCHHCLCCYHLCHCHYPCHCRHDTVAAAVTAIASVAAVTAAVSAATSASVTILLVASPHHNGSPPPPPWCCCKCWHCLWQCCYWPTASSVIVVDRHSFDTGLLLTVVCCLLLSLHPPLQLSLPTWHPPVLPPSMQPPLPVPPLPLWQLSPSGQTVPTEDRGSKCHGEVLLGREVEQVYFSPYFT